MDFNDVEGMNEIRFIDISNDAFSNVNKKEKITRQADIMKQFPTQSGYSNKIASYKKITIYYQKL